MPDKFTIEVKGLKEVIAKMDAMPKQISAQANGHLQRGAQLFVRNAQRDAPVDFGRLRQGISFTPNPVTGLAVELTSAAEYSPYMEWGTIEHVSVPADQSGYAIQFKGKGLRKSGGIFPRPFFFKNVPAAVAEIERGFATILNGVKL